MPPSTPEKPEPGKADQSEGKKATSAFLKPLLPSQELAAIVGSDPLATPGGGEQGLGIH
jgi:upstream activation factor subunit UAF30